MGPSTMKCKINETRLINERRQKALHIEPLGGKCTVHTLLFTLSVFKANPCYCL